MPTAMVLDPTASRHDDVVDLGPVLDGIRGKVIGFRVDIMWRAWDWVSEVWADELRRQGAEVVFWRAHQGRIDAEGERLNREMKEFLGSIDAALVGLGNCGSCTGWTIHDALAAAATGMPVAAVVTRNFEGLGRDLARRGGRSGLRLHVLPYPLNEQFENDVKAIAKEHFPMVLETLGYRVDAQQHAMA